MPALGHTQTTVLILFTAMSAIVLAVFAWIILRSGARVDFPEVKHGAYRLRAWWFGILASLIAASFAVTLWTFPYVWARGGRSAAGAYTVRVTAHQFAFSMPRRMPADTPIRFLVTSSDVNHGFGIYNPRGVLIGQVQAMPGYTNQLLFRFPAPGRYWIRCLEYCGIAHQDMFQPIDVYLPGP